MKYKIPMRVRTTAPGVNLCATQEPTLSSKTAHYLAAPDCKFEEHSRLKLLLLFQLISSLNKKTSIESEAKTGGEDVQTLMIFCLLQI